MSPATKGKHTLAPAELGDAGPYVLAPVGHAYVQAKALAVLLADLDRDERATILVYLTEQAR